MDAQSNIATNAAFTLRQPSVFLHSENGTNKLTFTNNEDAERGSGINESEWEKKQAAINEDEDEESMESFEEEVEESMEEEDEEV
jgi:hypothetical protein